MRSMKRTLGIALLVATSFFLACSSEGGFGGACSEIGCADGLNIDFAKTTPWEAGTYTVSVQADGTSTICTMTLPFDGCSGIKCSGTSATVLPQVSGCELPADQQDIAGLRIINSSPKKLIITVELAPEGGGASKTIGGATLAPDYDNTTTSRPNGPGCGPVCKVVAGLSVALK